MRFAPSAIGTLRRLVPKGRRRLIIVVAVLGTLWTASVVATNVVTPEAEAPLAQGQPEAAASPPTTSAGRPTVGPTTGPATGPTAAPTTTAPPTVRPGPGGDVLLSRNKAVVASSTQNDAD